MKNKAVQRRFVKELTHAVEKEVLALIQNNRIPGEWDGHELRMLLAEKFKDAAAMSLIRRYPKNTRARAYRRHMLMGGI